MKIAYTTVWDAMNIRSWSGLDRNIWESLAGAGAGIELVDQLKHGRSPARKLRKIWSVCVERKEFATQWDIDSARGYSQDAARRIAPLHADAIFSPSPIPLGFLERPEPIFLWTDAPFAGLVDFYPEFMKTRMSSATIKSGLTIDKATLDRCRIAIFSSHWAADFAVKYHSIDPNKVKVVPFGANIKVDHDLNQVETFISNRRNRPFQLLWLGVDWERKGAQTAVEAVRIMNERGVRAELTIVGCDPPPGIQLPDYVHCLGFISKATEEGVQQIKQLLRDSHVLILPTIAEAYGVVFVEAHAFGLPCAATTVGGVPTIVEDKKTGRLFDPAEPPSRWADWLCEVAENNTLYRELALASYARYKNYLNWDVSGRTVIDLMNSVLHERS